MLFTTSIRKNYLFLIAFFFVFSANAQVVINELMVRPPGTVSTPPNGLIYVDSQEYIELYNTGCSSVNVAGYFIAMKQTVGSINTGGTIRIPNVAAANIPPGGHVVIGSASPAGTAVGNIDIPLASADYCIYNGNFVLANTDGWCALYNATGVAIDCVYWSSSTSNLTSNTSDYNSTPICLPAGSPSVTLQTPFQLNTSNPSIVKYGGPNPTAGNPLSRQQDGAISWVQNLAPSINSTVVSGDCNGGTCVTTSLPAAPSVTSPVNYCQNAPAGSLAATALPGATLNWYGTNATGGTASATAPIPSTASVATTNYYVSQTIAGCESIRATIVVNVIPSLFPTISCGTNTLTSVQFNWTAVTNATGYNVAYQVNSTASVNVGAVGNVLTYTINSLNSGDNVTITVTPTGGAGTCFSATTFSCNTLVNNACGNCTTPNCPIVGVSSYANLNFSTGSCYTWTPQATNTTLTNYYIVTSDSSGFLGITQQATSSPGLCINRSAVIRPLVSSCSVATNIAPSVTNANGVASGFNPEWYGLTPNAQYVVVETIVLSSTCTLTSLCTNYYGCSTPSTPTASVTVQPTCTTPTGTIVVSSPTGVGNLYSIDGVNYQTGTTFSGLTANNYTVTVKKTPSGCVSNGTVVTISPVSSITPPTASATVQPTCTTPTGTIVVTAPTGANLEYSVNGTTYQFSTTFTGLAPGNYAITVRNTTNGCVSTATSVTINAVPTIATPTASVTVQPNCTTPTGTVVVTAPTGANLEYSVNGTTYQSSNTFTGLTPGNYAVTVRNTTNGCVSTATAVTINSVPIVAPPTASATVQPTCTTPTGTIVVTAPIGANLEYSVNGTTYQSSTTFTGLAPGNYAITVRNTTNGCVSTATSVTINAVPTIATPTASATVQPTCTTPTGTIVVTAPTGANLEYSVNGTTYQSSTTFTGLAPGNYTIVIRDNSGCLNFSTPISIINPSNDVVVSAPQPLRGCDFSNDGFIAFNLNQVINTVTGGAPYTVTFHETVTDANTGATPITDVTAYENINPWLQTIYIRVQSTTTGCYEVLPLQLIVNPTPEATTPNDYVLCDYTGAVGFETFDLTTTIPQILGSIDPSTHTVTFHTSFGDAQNDTGAIGNVTGYISASTTLYVRVENNLTGCYDVVSLDLVVNSLPNATQPNYPQYTLCDYNGAVGFEVFNLADQVDDILLGQTGMEVSFYPSLSDAQNNTNEITNLQYPNQDIYVQTLGIRITNSVTGCYVISTMDIRVVPLPTPIPPTQPYTICDDNQDGVSCDFDLASLVPDMLNGLTSYTITFHETLQDAELGNTAIDTSVPYCSIIPFLQTIYVRAVDNNTGCWSVIPIVLEVNPSPIAPVNLNDIVVCDQDNNTQNGLTRVDLTIRTPDVLAQQPLAASNYTVTYYTTELLAEQGTSPIIPATNFLAFNGQPIWVRVEDNNTGCYNLGTFDVIINMPLLLTTPTPLSVCDDDANPNDGFHTFDLTVRDVMITQGLSGYTVTYFPTLADAQNVTNAIGTPTAYTNITVPVQTVGVRVTSAAGCYSVTTLDIRVLPIPTPNTNPPSLGVQCDYNNPGDMLEYFNLTVNAAYILNNDPNLTLEYYNSQADAINQVNPILSPTNALVGDVDPNEQSVWIRVENNRVDYLGNNCYVLVEQPLTVNPLPTVATIADYQICEADPSGVNDGFEVFDLTSQIPALMANNPTPPTYTVLFYEDAALTIPINNASTYTNLTNPQTIYVQITNDATTCRSVVGQFNILVNPKPTINIVMADMLECDYDGVNDGLMLYTQNPTNAQPSLAGYVDDILGAAQTAPTYIVEFYYNSQADAEAGNSANALTNLDTYQVQTGTYWIRVTNTVTGCYQLDSFEVVIEKLAEPVITSNTGSNIACVNWNQTAVNNNLILDSGITAPNYTFNWYADGNLITGANSATYPVTDINADSVTYTVEAVSVNPPLLGCVSVITAASTFEVVRSGSAANITYTVTNAFEENQIITVTNDGYGIYEYSLDDGPRQASNVFENVSLGSHTIYVWDVRSPDGYSCGVVSIENVQVIDYPRYFTPNGDGFHETWNVTGLQNFDAITKIYIFDRYGKLLKQLSASGDGWDGTYNGQPLPSTDYWFTVDYPENGVMKQFKAHFSLKR